MTYEQPIRLTCEERHIMIDGIIDTSFQMMQKAIIRKNVNDLAIAWSGKRNQSKMGVARSSIFFNVLRDVQTLPALPRDFRLNFSEDEKSIARWDLHQILQSVVHSGLLENKRENLPRSRPRGRPKSGNVIDEDRGRRDSYYESSKIRAVVDEVLKDPIAVKEIDYAVRKSDILFKFLKYCYEATFRQIKKNEKAFLNSMKPAIKKYGWLHSKKKEVDWGYIPIESLSDDMIKKYAEAYAKDTIEHFQKGDKYKDDKIFLYTSAGIVFLCNACSLYVTSRS